MRVLRLERSEGGVERLKIDRAIVDLDISCQLYRELIVSMTVSASLLRVAAPCLVDQDTPHRFGGRGEKLPTITPWRCGVSHEPEIRLVNQCGGLKSDARPFGGHALPGDTAQFVVDE